EAPIQSCGSAAALPEFGEHLVGGGAILKFEEFLKRASSKLFGRLAENACGGRTGVKDATGFSGDEDHFRRVFDERAEARFAKAQLAVEVLKLARGVVECLRELRELVAAGDGEAAAEFASRQSMRCGVKCGERFGYASRDRQAHQA